MGGSLGSGVSQRRDRRLCERASRRRRTGDPPGRRRAVRRSASRSSARSVTARSAPPGRRIRGRHGVGLRGRDLLVGRGGASTVHEVAVTGIPAILIPWSGAADDHQTENVRWLSEVGACGAAARGRPRPMRAPRRRRSNGCVTTSTTRGELCPTAARPTRRGPPIGCLGRVDRARRPSIVAEMTEHAPRPHRSRSTSRSRIGCTSSASAARG